ncbi:MAG TPA: DUF4476 domain-containing protein [Bacteroidia bacterium]|jgi:hypothetical protein
MNKMYRTNTKNLLLLLMFLSVSAFKLLAQQNNNLVVFSENGEKFYVILNGIKQNNSSETNVKVTGLIQPQYKVKIIFENKNIPDVNQNVFMSDGGNPANMIEFTYSVSKTKKGYKLRYRSAAPFASVQTTPDQHVVTYTTGQPSDMNVTTTGGNVNVTSDGGMNGGTGTTTTTTTTTTNGTTTGNGNGTVGMNVGVNTGGNGFNMNVTVNDGTGNVQQTTTTTTTSSSTTTTSGGMNTSTTTTGNSGNTGMNVNVNTTGTGMNGGVNMNVTTTGDQLPDNHGTDPLPSNGGNMNSNYSSNSSPCTFPMSDFDFNSAKESVKNQSFADKKMIVAKQVIDNNCLTSSQVKEIMTLMDFENNKLDIAKYAYKKTLDRNNYYKVNDVFDFSSSVDELNKYIQSQK